MPQDRSHPTQQPSKSNVAGRNPPRPATGQQANAQKDRQEDVANRETPAEGGREELEEPDAPTFH
jgi:hypothetical protein